MSREFFCFFLGDLPRAWEIEIDLPTLPGLGRLPVTASRRRRPRHDNALRDRDLFDVGQRELVALAEALRYGRGDDATHRVRDLQQVARPTTCVEINQCDGCT